MRFENAIMYCDVISSLCYLQIKQGWISREDTKSLYCHNFKRYSQCSQENVGQDFVAWTLYKRFKKYPNLWVKFLKKTTSYSAVRGKYVCWLLSTRLQKGCWRLRWDHMLGSLFCFLFGLYYVIFSSISEWPIILIFEWHTSCADT
jgi:hypothetical protein